MAPRILPLLALVPAAAAAQVPAASPAYPPARLESAGDPADRLAGYLRTLAVSPRDVEALTGAGRAALDVGDPNAAIGFYARADGLAPRDGRIKAGLGTALLRMGKAGEALRLLNQAVDLTVPEADIASERGLAYDLRGDPRRAQRDYRLALAARPDDEVTRRLALSLAIGGDREGAIQLLTPLLYKNDAAAWRARAFALAMTGDVAGAGTIASAMMLPGQAAALQPFLVRLGTLDQAEKARAVHFGEMPSDGTAYSPAELAGFGASTAARSYRPEAAPTPPRTAVAAPRVTVSPALSAAAPSRAPTTAFLRNRQSLLRAFSPNAAQAEVRAMPPAASAATATPPRLATAAPATTPAAGAAGGRTVVADDVPLILALNAPAMAATPRQPASAAAPGTAPTRAAGPAPMAASTPIGARAGGMEAAQPRPAAADADAVRPAAGAADIPAKPSAAKAAGRVGADAATAPVKLAAVTPARAAPTAAERRAAEKARADEARRRKEAAEKAAEAKAAKANPERIWVQVAGGANKGDLPKAWTAAKAKAGATLAGRTPSTARVRATNRVLVGPFKTRDDAQALVNKLAGAFIVTTDKGEPVEKLALK